MPAVVYVGCCALEASDDVSAEDCEAAGDGSLSIMRLKSSCPSALSCEVSVAELIQMESRSDLKARTS